MLLRAEVQVQIRAPLLRACQYIPSIPAGTEMFSPTNNRAELSMQKLADSITLKTRSPGS